MSCKCYRILMLAVTVSLVPLGLWAQESAVTGAEGSTRSYSIPTLDLSRDRHRQVVVDREAGQYLGHPTTVLLEDGKTMLCVYPKGHGKGGIVYKRSADGGLTWSDRLDVPASWATSREVPTIHRVVDAGGKKRLIMWSGLYPARLSVSEDDGQRWSELKPVGDWGGIVVMGFVEKLSTPGRYLAMFHDDGRFFEKGGKRQRPVEFRLFKTFSDDGGLTWSQPEVVWKGTDVHLCEPGCIRSPDGKQLAVLLRENARRRNSHVIFSDDEGKTWTKPRALPASLTGDRHTGKYLDDGRLFITFRDKTLDSPTPGDWVAWVGKYEDIVAGREGQYRVRLMDNKRGSDCAYPGVEVLPDQTIVTTTYGHWTAGESPYIVSVRLKLAELDAMAKAGKTGIRVGLRSNGTKRGSTANGLNVLFVAIDDLRPELGCYGRNYVKSPNIDKLAASGVLFRRAYCQQPLCNPSRTSVMTGKRPESTGILGNHVDFRSKYPDLSTLPQHFMKNGYRSIGIGKLYHGPFNDQADCSKWDRLNDALSWSEPATRFGPRYYFTEDGMAAARRVFDKRTTDPNPKAWENSLLFGPMTEAPDIPDSALFDGKVGDAAIAKLQQLQQLDQPFFLAVGFIKPHTPFIAPKKYWDLYDAESIPLAANPSFPETAPQIGFHSSGEIRRYTDQPKKAPFDEKNRRRLKHGYLACVSHVDAQVGRLLDELERLQLADSTIVVLWGDHGYHLGEQSMWGKVTTFENAARVPLIVRMPGAEGNGKQSDALVELVDLYPTLADLAGLPEPKHLEGVSFRSLLQKPNRKWKTAAFTDQPARGNWDRGGTVVGRSMRTDRYRYTEWVERASGATLARQLYDQNSDPLETKNLAAEVRHADLVESLHAQLAKGWAGAQGESAEFTDRQPKVKQETGDVQGLAVGFDSLRPGAFERLTDASGVWEAAEGHASVHSQHARNGIHSLRLLGGKEKSVIWIPSAQESAPNELSFWFERWTRRSPWDFRVEAFVDKEWKTIHHDTSRASVGSFRNHLSLTISSPLPSKFRFTCTSPRTSGLMIDDLRYGRRDVIEKRGKSN